MSILYGMFLPAEILYIFYCHLDSLFFFNLLKPCTEFSLDIAGLSWIGTCTELGGAPL